MIFFKGWENTKYTWGVFVIFLLTVPALVILTRLITLTQMCGKLKMAKLIIMVAAFAPQAGKSTFWVTLLRLS